MRAYFFFLFVCPFMMVAQNQPASPANGSTDCPTFGKKNVATKAGLFQYMRTNKPQKAEQSTVYRTSALPTLKPATEEKEAIALKREKRAERAAARQQRQAQPDPSRQEEPIVAEATPTKTNDPVFTKKDKAANTDSSTDKVEMDTASDDPKTIAEKQASIENQSSAKEDAAKRAEERDKKIRKAATQDKVKRVFKRTHKPSSKRNSQKCPQF